MQCIFDFARCKKYTNLARRWRSEWDGLYTGRPLFVCAVNNITRTGAAVLILFFTRADVLIYRVKPRLTLFHLAPQAGFLLMRSGYLSFWLRNIPYPLFILLILLIPFPWCTFFFGAFGPASSYPHQHPVYPLSFYFILLKSKWRFGGCLRTSSRGLFGG